MGEAMNPTERCIRAFEFAETDRVPSHDNINHRALVRKYGGSLCDKNYWAAAKKTCLALGIDMVRLVRGEISVPEGTIHTGSGWMTKEYSYTT